MSEEIDVLRLVAARLDAARIPYMVSRSIAMSYYAQPRMTRDIDIVVEITATDVDRVAALFAPDFYCDPDMIREAVARQGMFNVIHSELVIKVDCIVRKDTPYRRTEFARRQRITVDDSTLWLVTAEDLLLSKLAWAKPSHSELQIEDVRNLIACVPNLDWPYIERWAVDLTVTDLLPGGACMTDTPDAICDRYRVMLMRRSGAERLKMACDMFDAARRLACAGLGDPAGTNRSPEFRVRLFLRLYGRDFDPETVAHIAARLSLPGKHVSDA